MTPRHRAEARSVSDYWKHPWSRRRFVGAAAAGGAGLAGLALVGCGGDEKSSDKKAPAATQKPAAPAAATKAPASTRRVGGTLKFPMVGLSSGDPPTLYPFENLTYLAQIPSAYHYGRLLRSKAGPDISPTDFTALEGDLAQSWQQPDGTTYVFTLKPNIKFHNKAPLNGRAATARDWMQSYEAFLGKSQNGNKWKSLVAKAEAPDDKTIKITLVNPFAPFLTSHASTPEGPWFIPVETISNNQVLKDPVGTGPYVFAQYDTGVAIRWDRNKEYYDSDRPNYDRVEASLFNDSQRVIAALQAGDLDLSGLSGAVYNDAKAKLNPKGQQFFEQTVVVGGFYFNFDNKPWQDKRVRQALSMAMDRAGLDKVLDQTAKGDWFSHISPAMAPYYMSPRDNQKEFGPKAALFQKNIAEAKKLLAAAGVPTPFKFKIVANVDRYGPVAKQSWELIQSVIKEAGFEGELQFMEYAAYIQSIFVGKIPPDSVGLGPLIGSARDPDDYFYTLYDTSAPRHNWGGTPIPEQPQLEAAFKKSRTILDLKERVAFVKDIQRDMAESMLIVPYIAGAGFSYAQPWIENLYWKGGYGYIVEAFAKSQFTEERLKKG